MKTSFALLLACLLLGLATSASARAAQRKPNIILVLADDLGAQELSCYGNRKHATPHLDRMAAEGTRFETFYVNPLCTPTRVALMTGQYGFHNGFLGMQNPAFTPRMNSPLKEIANHFTHAKLLQAAGYKTALVGKWQLSGKLPTLVYDAGFDEYRMWAYEHNLPAGVPHEGRSRNPGNRKIGDRYWWPSIVENGKYRPTTEQDFGPDLFNDYVIDFARRHRDEPFFVYCTSVLTHDPIVETPDPANPGSRLPASFENNLEYLDHLMGKLFAALKSAGLEDDTLVFFVGDNGTGGRGKGTLTEAGVRVPCIVRGPGVQRGVVSRAVADVTDLLPTLADFAGAKLPDDRPIDGYSLGPVLRGERERHRDWIYAHLDDGRIVRDERWLLEIDRLRNGSRDERFFDCGASRDGTGYRDMTNSDDPEAQGARARFAAILAAMPAPVPHPGMELRGRIKAATTATGDDSRAATFARRDLDRDGRLSLEEFTTTGVRSADEAKAVFAQWDADRNGRLNADEFIARGKPK